MRVKTSVEMFSLRLPIARGVGLKLWVFLCLDDILEDMIVGCDGVLHGVYVVTALV